MAGLRRRKKTEAVERPVAVDDFIYDEPEEGTDTLSAVSDTPEEAIRKIRKGKTPVQRDAYGVDSEEESASTDAADGAEDLSQEQAEKAEGRKVYSGGIMLDNDLQPIETEGRRKGLREHRRIRILILGGITAILIAFVGAYIFHRIMPEVGILGAPESAISSAVTPVQSFFSGLTEAVAGYFRGMKLRANIEAAYNAVVAENEQLTYRAMLADELERTLSQYEDLSDEIRANREMRPIVATVIGKSDNNYFSTLTISKGTADGVEDYMAVTVGGALVGYTENVQAHSATVRTVIDSDASIAALIQSSRDHGTVRGTLGIDGTPMCRMYYLPDDNLPRPGDLVVTSGVGLSFPKGIPIGVIRESTRGMENNKQYIVLEPQADFQHLEYVIVLRYKPKAEEVQGRENGRTEIELVPLESARPSPIVPQIAASLFDEVTATPLGIGEPETPTPSPEATETPSPTPSPSATPAQEEEPEIEYQIVSLRGEPTPSPTPTLEPTWTPYITPDPEGMTWEEEEGE